MVRGGGFRQLNFEFLIILSRIWKTIWQHPQQGVILVNLKSGGLREKHALAAWNLGTISAFA
jgi:hypothetical protein